MAYAFVSFATTLTEEGDDNKHGLKDTILLGLLTTASVSVNLVIMGLLVSFLKLFCVPIFVVVGFLSTGSWNFEDRKTAKETILNGLTCMFVPCLARHSGSGEVTLGLAMTYYVIFNFGYGLTSRACMLQYITPPLNTDRPVYYCHIPPENMTCSNYTTFSAPPNLTTESLLNCSKNLFSFDHLERKDYVTYCIDGYLDRNDDIYIYIIATLGALLSLFLSLRLAMLGKVSNEKRMSLRNASTIKNITHRGGKRVF